MEREAQRLRVDNDRLRQQRQREAGFAEAASLESVLAELGVPLNSTLERLIQETPQGIVETAVDSLRKALSSSQVRNPGGFLNKAIRDAWRPNKTYQEKVGMEEFNRWWKWAYQEKLVVAATQVDGIQHVLTAADVWVPFEEAATLNPLP